MISSWEQAQEREEEKGSDLKWEQKSCNKESCDHGDLPIIQSEHDIDKQYSESSTEAE